MSGLEQQHEVERKFRVDDTFVMPDVLPLLPAGFTAKDLGTVTMVAEYYDTEDLRLLCWGITLRRRQGGLDDGWHLKLPTKNVDGRIELRMPLSDQLPVEFGDAVASITRGDTLERIATINTARSITELGDPNPVIELVNDHVSISTANRPMLNHGVISFNEIELELQDHAYEDEWDALGEALVDAGARPSTVKKIAAALGSAVALHPEFDHEIRVKGKSSLSDAFLAYFNEHARNLVLADISARLGLADGIHQMRVSSRRLRSAIKLLEADLDAERAIALEDELQWIASELGAARDVEVQFERLAAHAEVLDEEVRDAVLGTLREQLAHRTQSAQGAVLAAIRSDRYQYLIEDLISATHDPKFIVKGDSKARDELGKPVAAMWHRLRKGFEHIELDSPSEEWHRLRIAAKRARYALDLYDQVVDADRLADRMSMLTDVLGSHQDAHVSQLLLRELGAQADGLAAFGLGQLHAYERDFELLDRIRAFDLWKDTRKAASKTKALGR